MTLCDAPPCLSYIVLSFFSTSVPNNLKKLKQKDVHSKRYIHRCSEVHSSKNYKII